MTPRSAPFGISEQMTPAASGASTLEECEVTYMAVQDVERLRLHPYAPSGRNGNNKRNRSINRNNSGKGTFGIGK